MWDTDAATGRPIGRPLTGHTVVVYCVAYSPDGQRLASASYDRTVQIWRAGAPETLVGHTDAVHGVAFSPDGRRLATASQDHKARLWDVVDGEPAAQHGGDAETLCAKLTTNMSKEQWRVWVAPDIDYIPACPDLPVPPGN